MRGPEEREQGCAMGNQMVNSQLHKLSYRVDWEEAGLIMTIDATFN